MGTCELNNDPFNKQAKLCIEKIKELKKHKNQAMKMDFGDIEKLSKIFTKANELDEQLTNKDMVDLKNFLDLCKEDKKSKYAEKVVKYKKIEDLFLDAKSVTNQEAEDMLKRGIENMKNVI